MLYDKRWDKTETKADPFTLESLIEWLEMQPRNETYDYTDPYNCLLCQYFEAMGILRPSVVYSTVWDENDGGHTIHFPDVLRAVSIGPDKISSWTFGKALKRAKAAFPSG